MVRHAPSFRLSKREWWSSVVTVVEAAIANVKRAWMMLQWCGDFYKGFSGHCTIKVEVKWPLNNGTRFKWELARVSKLTV